MLKKQVGNVKVFVDFKELVQSPFYDRKAHVNKYVVTCSNVDTNKQILFPFYDSIYHTQESPQYHDELMDSILYTIHLDYFYDDSRFPTFEDFANEFGYDTDSRKAEKTYKAVIKQGKKLQSVFTEDIIEQLGDDY